MGVDPNYINVFFSHGKTRVNPRPLVTYGRPSIVLRGSAKVTEPGSWPRRCHGNDRGPRNDGHVGVEHHGHMQLGDMQFNPLGLGAPSPVNQPSNIAVVAGKWIRIESMYFLLKNGGYSSDRYVIVYQRVSLSQWPNFKLFGITYLVGKISRSNGFFFRVHWLSEG